MTDARASLWYEDAMFYHIYPLGLCGAPARNDFASPPVPRIAAIEEWIDHIAGLGLNAVYLGPVFESTSHGYDTADYTMVDRRLGTTEDFRRVIRAMRERGIRVVLDGVFNHVGRDFQPFRDLREKGSSSPYASWFHGVDFSRRSPYGDPFAYTGWHEHYSLVKLELANPEVRRYLFDAVAGWIKELDIDGLRLDAADQVDPGFLRALVAHCKAIRPDFWLVGEVVVGDYRRWLDGAGLDSVTNYECYKGLYSSHVDGNYFEIAYSLERQFGKEGIYRGRRLYSFADNHDVSRVASSLRDPAHLYPLHVLLFTMPGIPSIYYGSEWGIRGEKATNTDAPLRPALELGRMRSAAPEPDLPRAVATLARIRREQPALRHGEYAQRFVASLQLCFRRRSAERCIDVAVNAAGEAASVPIEPGSYVDLLNGNERIRVLPSKPAVTVPRCWGRILLREG